MNMYEIMLEQIQDSYLSLNPTDKITDKNKIQTLELANYYSSNVLEILKTNLASLIQISVSLNNLFDTDNCTSVLVAIGNELDVIKLDKSEKHPLLTIHYPILPEIHKETFFELSKYIYYGIANLKHYDSIKTHLDKNSFSNKNTLEKLIHLSNQLPLLTV